MPFRMSPGYLYVLDENNRPVPESDVLKWAAWSDAHDRHVGDDTVGDVRVSTVFLGVNTRFLGDGCPVLWETMIFGGPLDMYQERYTSHEAAVEGHARALEAVRLEAPPTEH